MARKIGIVMAADGEAEFKKALQEVRKETMLLNSELKKISAEYEGNANSLEALQKKQAALEKQTENYEKAVKSAKDGLSNAQSEQKKAAERYEELKKALENAKKAQEEMQASGKEGTDEYSKQSKEVELYSKKLTDQGTQCEKCGDKVRDWSKKVNDAETNLIKSNNALQQNEKYLKEAESAADGCAKSIDEFGKKTEEAANKAGSFSEKIAGGLANKLTSEGIDLLKQGVQAVIDTVMDASSAAATLAANTGLTTAEAERYESVMKQIKGDNFGESYSEVASVMGQIIQTMGELDDSSMIDLTESAMTLSNTFGMDVSETIRAVNVMTQTMGVTASQAFDLIAKGAQNGLNRSDELVDNLTEYGSLWGQAGFSAEEAFAIMENGLDAGAYNLDKVNDFVKEFGISLSDGRIEDNIDSFSENTKSLFEAWKNGEATTADVFYSVISDLENMTDQQKALTIASDTWSALGEDNAMGVLSALNDVNDGYKNVQGTMDQLKETQFSDLQSNIDALGSALEERFLAPIAEKIEPALSGLASALTDAVAVDDTQPSIFDKFLEEINDANDAIGEMIDNISDSVSAAEIDTSSMEAYKGILLETNGIEEKSEWQKYQLKAVVDELSGSIPELAAAFDEETSSINLTNEEIENLIENQEKLVMQQALSDAREQSMKTIAEAQINLAKAQSAYDDAVERAEQQQAEYNEKLKESGNMKASAAAGTMTLEQATKDEADALEKAKKQLEEAETQHQDLEDALSGLDEQYSTTTESIESNSDAVDSNVAKQEQLAARQGKTVDSTKELSMAADDATDSIDGTTDSLEESADAVDEWAEAQKTAAESVKSAYESTADSIKSALDFDPWSSFDGGEDLTVEEMVANLQSYAEGVTKMKENMAYVLETMGEDLAPEVVSSLESMGEEAANTWAHLANTLEKQGSEVGSEGYELVKEFSDQWLENLDIQDETSSVMAANVTAVQDALGQLGSSDVDFDELQETITDALSGTDWGELTDGEQEALQEAVETARAVGIEIPDGLADGIASGDTSYSSALDQINGSITGKLEGLAGVAKSLGIQIPADITAGINQGGPAAEAAYQSLIELLSGYEATAQSDASAVGSAAASGYSEGLAAGTDSASSAGSTVASAGSDGAESSKDEYNAAGRTAASNFASGILSGTGTARNNAITLANAAKQGLNTKVGEFQSIGYNMSAGVASGITSGSVKAVNAAILMATRTLTKTKKILDIKSPSRVFKKEVGEQIGAGTAKGITDSTSKVVKAAEKMAEQATMKSSTWAKKYQAKIANNFGVSQKDDDGKKKSNADYYSEIYQKAQSYFDNMSVKYNLSDEQQLAYWTSVSKSLKKGTQAWYDAKEKLQTLTANVKENIDAAYDDIVDSAEDYLEKTETIENVSLTDEKAYWEGVLKTVKEGSDAWYTVQKKINSIKEKIGTVSNASSLLSTYKTYYELSEKAEMDYWDAIRQQYAAGTEERLTADEKYLDAKEDYYDKLTSLYEDYKEDVEDIDKELDDSIKSLTETYEENLKSRTKSIADAFSLFDEFTSESESGKTLLFNIQTQAAGYQDWTEILQTLSGRGILSEDLMQELTEQGPDISAQLHALNTLTDEELSAYNEAYQKKMDLAAAQAAKEYADSKADLENQTAALREQAEKDKADLQATYDAAVAKANTGMSAGLSDLASRIASIASDQTAALVAALKGETVKEGAESSTGASVSNDTLTDAGISTAAVVSSAAAGASASSSGAGAGSTAASSTQGDAITLDKTHKTQIKDIIYSGQKLKKLSDADRKKHSTLYNYIFDQYKRATTTSMIKSMAQVLGISVDKTPTSAQKKKVLSALKKNGFRTGGTVYDDFAWMDEALETDGPEMIVRKSDNAILTRVQPGDEIIDAATAANMAAWGKYSPEAYTAALSTTAALNGATEMSQASTARLEGMMSQMMDVLGDYLPYLAQRQQIVMDSGAVVGQTVGLMSNALAMRARRTR